MNYTEAAIEVNRVTLNMYGYYILNGFLFDSDLDERMNDGFIAGVLTPTLLRIEQLRRNLK